MLKRLLGDKKPTELTHVDMNARLELNGLMHYVDCPQLWPPTLAVCLVHRCSLWRLFVSWQVRELASRVKKLEDSGEEKPYVAAELKR